MPQPRPTLILFARAPFPGAVKTRLASLLTDEGAARLYRAFLEDAARSYADPRWDPVLYADPDPEDSALASLFDGRWRREAQSAGDLGERLTAAFEAERGRGSRALAAVGSDHPALPRSSLRELFDRISTDADVAFVPAEDGGYCAVGLSVRASPRDVFREIPWSSPSTLSATLRRTRRAGLSVALLEPAYDVDRPEDLERLRADLARRDPAGEDYPRATAQALAALTGRELR